MVSRIPPPVGGPAPRRSRYAGLLSLLLVVAVAVGAWLLEGSGDTPTSAVDGTGASAPAQTPGPSGSPGPGDTSPDPTPSPSASPEQSVAPTVDPGSGLPTVYLLDLPPEAAETVASIDRGPPYAYDQDGGTFGNYEGLLPDQERGYYQEFTVETPGSYDRGARRIVEGAEGELYWTDDHYASFLQVVQ